MMLDTSWSFYHSIDQNVLVETITLKNALQQVQFVEWLTQILRRIIIKEIANNVDVFQARR